MINIVKFGRVRFNEHFKLDLKYLSIYQSLFFSLLFLIDIDIDLMHVGQVSIDNKILTVDSTLVTILGS